MQIDNYTLDGEDEQLLELLDDSEMECWRDHFDEVCSSAQS